MTWQPYQGKLGIITGGSRGIGEAVARRLAAKGCNLLLVYTSASSRDRVERLADDLAAAHNTACHVVKADLGEAAAATTTIMHAAHALNAACCRRRGAEQRPLQIDVLINNAGVECNQRLGQGGGGDGGITAERFARVYGVNVLAPLLLTQAVAAYLPTDRSGRIVNVSSVSSAIGYEGHSVYAGSKAALEAMTRTWSRELAARATVNAVNPGPVWNDMYRASGRAMWDLNQPYMDATPLAEYGGEARVREMVVAEGCGDGGEKEEEEEEEEKAWRLFDRTVREDMGGRRPALCSEVAGTIDMLCSEEAGWTTGSVVCANGGMKMT